MSREVTMYEAIGSKSKIGVDGKSCCGDTPRDLSVRWSPRLTNGSGAPTQPAAPNRVNQPVSPCSPGVRPV
jgi:hypothetical protein